MTELQPITTLSLADLGRPIEIHTDSGSVVAGRLEHLDGKAHIQTLPAYGAGELRMTIVREIILKVGGFTFEDNGSAEWRRKDRP